MIDFDKMIERHISREHKPKEIGKYYPSEIGSCLRKLWYSYKYPMDVDPQLRKIFEVGNMLHGFVVEVLKSEKNAEVELIKAEFPFKIEKKDFVISGRVDDLVLVRESGRNVLVEVKSHRDVNLIKEPLQNHVIQLMFYMHATGVHEGIILYIDKNNLKTRIFEVEYSNQKGKEIEKRFEQLNNDLKNNALPVAEAKQSEQTIWMCSFCEYKNKCDLDEK